MKEKIKQDSKIKTKVRKLIKDGSVKDLQENVTEIADQISVSSKNDLCRYIAFRRHILEMFSKSLEYDVDGKYETEGAVHDIIFPRKGDTDSTPFDDHNLWMIDERLNFTNYVASDIPLDGGNTERPDLIAYNHMVFFRGDNEPSNPITIFEFKRPHREDFVNASSKEDPVEQIVRYVNNIIDDKYKTPKGRTIRVEKNTPFYGYIVCTLTKKVTDWLFRQKGCKPMPDGQGYFKWEENINLYIEILSWDKILKDAELRNKLFFHKLGI